jgi:hypothetical protein
MKTNVRACASLCLVLAMASLATAAPTVLISGGPYQNGGGGEITATIESSSPFQTFCVELNEHIALGGVYNFDINTKAVAGGVGGGSPDPLDPRTAWLYQKFLNNDLPGYDFANTGIGRAISAGALQDAIWYIEDEITTLPTGLATDFYNLIPADLQGIGDVRVLNLYTAPNAAGAARTECQDVLGYFPTPGVPVPGAILLGGLGCALVGCLRRRSAK